MTTINDQLKLAATNADLSPDAAQLLQDFFLKLATPQQKDQLDAWLNQSEANSHFFDLLLELNREGTGASTLQVLQQYKRKPEQKINWVKRILLYPVYVFLLLSAVDAFWPGGPFKQWLKGKPFSEINWTRITLSTQDQPKSIYLSDSTLVELSPNSTLIYPEEFDPLERVVTLKGTARFVVRKRPGAAFKVEGSNTFASTVEGEFVFNQKDNDRASVLNTSGFLSFGYESTSVWGVEAGEEAYWKPGEIRVQKPVKE